MKHTGILITGIFLACVVCSGIPAAAATENPNALVNAHATMVTQVTPQEFVSGSTPSPWWQTLPHQIVEQIGTLRNTLWSNQQTTTVPQECVTPIPTLTPVAPPLPQKT